VSSEHLQEDALNMHFDGELAPAEAASVQSHLASCGDCSERLSSMQRLREMITVSSEQAASEVDFDAMFARVEQATQAAPLPGLWERITLWVAESLEHNPMKVWAPVGGFAVAAIALITVLSQSSSPSVDDEQELARRGVIAEERERKRERMMLAQAADPVTADDSAEAANASEVVQVDFGSNTGTVFEIALAGGASTPVVWINDED